VDNLHRHPDYAPVGKEPAGDNSKRLAEDNDLPPRAAEASLTNTDDTLTFEADAEFGSMHLPNITPKRFNLLKYGR
jgi:DNA repair and recombination protein RAD52